MAQIQIWTRDVSGTSPFGDKAPQHTFFIKINDNVTSYGFSPKDGYEGIPIAHGSVKYNDSSRYEFNTSQGDYKGEFEITNNHLVFPNDNFKTTQILKLKREARI